MDCKQCKHLKRYGRYSKCEMFDNITLYGEVGHEPIVKDCGHCSPIELGSRECDLYCHWKPFKKVLKSNGRYMYLLQTDCGRVIKYGAGGYGTSEIMQEVCSKCKRLIKMHYIRGMEE